MSQASSAGVPSSQRTRRARRSSSGTQILPRESMETKESTLSTEKKKYDRSHLFWREWCRNCTRMPVGCISTARGARPRWRWRERMVGRKGLIIIVGCPRAVHVSPTHPLNPRQIITRPTRPTTCSSCTHPPIRTTKSPAPTSTRTLSSYPNP